MISYRYRNIWHKYRDMKFCPYRTALLSINLSNPNIPFRGGPSPKNSRSTDLQAEHNYRSAIFVQEIWCRLEKAVHVQMQGPYGRVNSRRYSFTLFLAIPMGAAIAFYRGRQWVFLCLLLHSMSFHFLPSQGAGKDWSLVRNKGLWVSCFTLSQVFPQS